MPKILDCTLRDGGYINNWKFDSAKDIINLLQMSGVDFIEIGFYHHDLNNIIPDDCSNIFAMVEYSKTKIEEIPNIKESKIKNLRIIFKKYDSKNALEYCKKLKNKGYNLFINATFVNQYRENELIELIEKINDITPKAFTLTDSMGVYTSNDIRRMYKIINSVLKSNIALCFHSHNNLGLSFSNAKTLIELNNTYELIIDSCLFGMGRGAGNIKTEELMEYLNKGQYKIKYLYDAIEKYIKPIYKKQPWGYSVTYYLSALYGCHPNYALDLIKKKIDLDKINTIFSLIPEEKKAVYDKEFISQKFLVNN